MKIAWQKIRKLFITKILHADDTPHRIALGVGIGFFVAFTPTVGIQMFIAFALAAVFRANKAICVPMVWITNPVTIPVIYPLCYTLGSNLLGGRSGDLPGELAAESVASPITQLREEGFGLLMTSQFWSEVAVELSRATLELWTGCLLAAFIFGATFYFISRTLVGSYRSRRREFIVQTRASRRSERQIAKAIKAQTPMT